MNQQNSPDYQRNSQQGQQYQAHNQNAPQVTPQNYPPQSYGQQPYGQPPPYGYSNYPPQPQKQGGSGWITCLIIFLVLACIGCCVIIPLLYFLGSFSISFLDVFLDDLMLGL